MEGKRSTQFEEEEKTIICRMLLTRPTCERFVFLPNEVGFSDNINLLLQPGKQVEID